MENFKKLSGNELSELNHLTFDIEKLATKDYLHVYNHLPLSFRQELAKLRVLLSKEVDRRENEL